MVQWLHGIVIGTTLQIQIAIATSSTYSMEPFTAIDSENGKSLTTQWIQLTIKPTHCLMVTLSAQVTSHQTLVIIHVAVLFS